MTKIKNLIYIPDSSNNGKEFIFDEIFTEEAKKTIDYTNYLTLSFEEYCSQLNERYNMRLYKNEYSNFFEYYFNNNYQEFQNLIISIYKDQKQNLIDNYFYVSIQEIMEKFQERMLEQFNSQQNFILSDMDFIFNFNKTIISSSSLEYSDINEFLDDNDLNPSYHQGIPYIGVTELLQDYDKSITDNQTNNKINYNFRYFEFNFKAEEQHKLISKIELYGPVGTCFILNHQPHLIYITQSALLEQNHNEETTIDIVHGFYRLDTKGQVLLESISFPKDAIPSNITEEEKNVKILIYYDDD